MGNGYGCKLGCPQSASCSTSVSSVPTQHCLVGYRTSLSPIQYKKLSTTVVNCLTIFITSTRSRLWMCSIRRYLSRDVNVKCACNAVSHKCLYSTRWQCLYSMQLAILATSENVLFPGHNHLLTTVLITRHFIWWGWSAVSGHQYQCFAGRYDQETGHF